MPIIRSLSTAVAASGLPLERGGSSAVGRGRSGRTDNEGERLMHLVGWFIWILLLSVCQETSISTKAVRKILGYKISWQSVHWEPTCCVRTDRHDEGSSRFSQYSGGSPTNLGYCTKKRPVKNKETQVLQIWWCGL